MPKYIYVIIECRANNERVATSIKRVCSDFEFAKALRIRLAAMAAKNQFYYLNGYELDERKGE